MTEKKYRPLSDNEKAMYDKRFISVEKNINILKDEIVILNFKIDKEIQHEAVKQTQIMKARLKDATLKLEQQEFNYNDIVDKTKNGVEIKEEKEDVGTKVTYTTNVDGAAPKTETTTTITKGE